MLNDEDGDTSNLDKPKFYDFDFETKTVDGIEYGHKVPKKRGRPKGSKDKTKRQRRTKSQMKPDVQEDASVNLAQVVLNQNSTFGGWDPDEEFVEATIKLSVAQQLASDDQPSWIKAIDREKTKLAAAKTWRDATPDELKSQKQVLPVQIILTRKRDQSYKARQVVLGNLMRKNGDLEVF